MYLLIRHTQATLVATVNATMSRLKTPGGLTTDGMTANHKRHSKFNSTTFVHAECSYTVSVNQCAGESPSTRPTAAHEGNACTQGFVWDEGRRRFPAADGLG